MKLILALALYGFCLHAAHAGNAAGETFLMQGLTEYEIGHYAAASRHFRDAAANGNARAAEILALMYRFGDRLYGSQFGADAVESARWTAIAAERRFTTIVNATAPTR